jgi:hypothetical protein
MREIEVRPIAGAIGAEMADVDVSEELDERTIGAIRRALLAHCVVFFRDQEESAERQKAVTRRFGAIFIHPNYRGMRPEIVQITREPGDARSTWRCTMLGGSAASCAARRSAAGHCSEALPRNQGRQHHRRGAPRPPQRRARAAAD